MASVKTCTQTGARQSCRWHFKGGHSKQRLPRFSYRRASESEWARGRKVGRVCFLTLPLSANLVTSDVSLEQDDTVYLGIDADLYAPEDRGLSVLIAWSKLSKAAKFKLWNFENLNTVSMDELKAKKSANFCWRITGMEPCFAHSVLTQTYCHHKRFNRSKAKKSSKEDFTCVKNEKKASTKKHSSVNSAAVDLFHKE